jgi:hypothetical protein
LCAGEDTIVQPAENPAARLPEPAHEPPRKRAEERGFIAT